MTLEDLKNRFHNNNVPDRWYALNEGVKLDACVLYKNYSKWEYFYLDEKGDRHDCKFFYNEEEAYDYLWSKMERQLIVFKTKPRNSQ